jgi:hypothetical protein
VPVSIAYEYEPESNFLLAIDVFAVIYYMIDIGVVSTTSYTDDYGTINRTKLKIIVAYS